MWRIRAVETRAMQLFEEKLIRGSVHPYIGVDAAAGEAASRRRPHGESNQWTISTRVAAATRISDIADRAAGYGFPGVVVDGNDVLEMRAVTAEAVARARAGEGPTLIEAKSYRITPHSAATQTDLRDPAELEEWRARDPILRFARRLAEGGSSHGRLEQLELQAKQGGDTAVEWGPECAPPRTGPRNP